MDERTTRQIHPGRGAWWGLWFGIGLAGVFVTTTLITLQLVSVLVVVAAGIVLGVLWGSLGPAQPPRGPAPAQPLTVEQVETSSFETGPPWTASSTRDDATSGG